MTAVKICGLKDTRARDAAAKAGARFAGFVFYPKSPRNITIEEAAPLVKQAPASLTSIGLFVNPDDDLLNRVLASVPLGMIQLHGDETPQRVAQIKSTFGKPVMKALRIAGPDDLTQVGAYAAQSDWLLFDAKIEGIVGGTGQAFDWSILSGFKPGKPWMLAGGLTADNVAAALATLTPDAVDVSSGVESAPGIKDPCKITAFIESVHACKTA